jgi:hypothetical protein
MTPSPRRRPSQRCLRALIVSLLLLPAIAVAERAPKPDKPPSPDPKSAVKTDAKPAAARTPAAAPGGDVGAMAAHIAVPGLPRFEEPAAYSVDLVMRTTEGKDMVMHRFVDQGKVRTDINGEGTAISVIDLGDKKGTTLVLMPEEKRGIKQSREAMGALTAKMDLKDARLGRVEAEKDAKFEDLGEETIDGRIVKKIRMSMTEGSALGWFDKSTGAPVKMESVVEGKTASIEWKNMKPGPQPAAIYEIPEGYEITDMDEMMSKMKTIGAMPGMGGMAGATLSGMAGMGGMPGMSGGVKGIAGGMGQNFGSQMGASMGSTLGASLGGPLGAMAGHYLGGKIGGAIGRKAAETLVPGK